MSRGLWPFAVIGGQDGHWDGCTPMPWPDMGEYAPSLMTCRNHVVPLRRPRARRLRDAIRVHLDAGDIDPRLYEVIALLESCDT